ncbi:energy-coupling factor transporter ATPase [Spiroplasma endosymbiont of Anurida maritima]|uniref:energy-coupling factor transporter ATPase n=1 Tax=Spiroplasma endosymbiont of Anurida maritima TaxID=2967972 RepID=UPI0036D27717
MSKIKKNIKKNKNSFDYKNIQTPIKLTNIHYTYSPKTPYEFKAIDDITLEIKPNIITAVIGSTGSGKSTLVQHINGLIIPSKGTVEVNGFEIKGKQKRIKNIKQLRKSVGLVFQFPEYQLFEETVEKDIIFGPVHLGENKEEAKINAKKYISLVGLGEEYLNRSPFNLSGGQKRRVAVAGILAMEGNTLILDEPTAGLDPEGEVDFIHLFNKINKEEKRRIVLVTHNMDHVLEIADEVIALKKGKLIKQGTPSEIFSDKSLLEELEIEPPKIYKVVYQLQEKGLNLQTDKIRTIKDLASQIIAAKKGE